MKKVGSLILLVAILAFACSAFGDDLIADIFPSDIEVYYGYNGGTKLEVPTYSDGTTVYVPLEALMQMLGGSYEAQEGKVTIAINTETLPPLIAKDASSEMKPETSWEYLNYYCMDRYGLTLDEFLPENVIKKIDTAITKNVDIDKLLAAIYETASAGGEVTRKLDALIK